MLILVLEYQILVMDNIYYLLNTQKVHECEVKRGCSGVGLKLTARGKRNRFTILIAFTFCLQNAVCAEWIGSGASEVTTHLIGKRKIILILNLFL